MTWLTGWRAAGSVLIRVNADDNAKHARYDFILSGATSSALQISADPHERSLYGVNANSANSRD